MVDWKSPDRIQSDSAIFNKIMMAFLGLYIWEFLTTLSFDWSVFTGRRKFKLPMIFYFLCRYMLLISIIGINVSLNTTKQLNCQALFTINQIAGNIAIATASTLLALRTVAIWSRKLFIVIPLGLLGLVQWAILLHGVITVRSLWEPTLNTCLVTDSKLIFLQLIYIYTMSYDFIVLLASSIGLVMTAGRSDLWELLFQDGIVYFVVAFTANLIPTVLLLLDLNPAMNIMTTVPAAVASSIVACRGFVRLSTWASSREVYVNSQSASHHPHNRPMTSAAVSDAKPSSFAKNLRLGTTAKFTDGVHISMEAYTTVDHRGASSPYDKHEEEDWEKDPSIVSTRSDLESGNVGPTARPPTALATEPKSETKITFVPNLKD